jgi:hypothetical protein
MVAGNRIGILYIDENDKREDLASLLLYALCEKKRA